MNRYEILTGKEPPEEKKDYVMGVDVGSGDSSSASIWTLQSQSYEKQLDLLAGSLDDPSVAITHMQAPPPVFAAPPALVRVQVSEDLHVGDLLGADGEGNIRKITPGLTPVGVVVQPTNLEDGTMTMRTCSTIDEQFQYMRRIEEADNRARSATARASIDRRPTHTGNLHEHPRMQQRLKVPNNHVIVDRNEWSRARQRRGSR